MEHQKIDVNKALFSAWISDPSVIGLTDSTQVESMTGAFPFCQILQSLRPKTLQKQGDPVFKSALAKAALYSPKRRVLYNLLNRPELMKPVAALIVQTETYHELLEENDYEYSAKQVAEKTESPELPAPDVTENNVLSEDSISAGQLPVQPEPEYPALTNRDEENPDLKKEVLEYTSMDEEGKMILENIASADFFAFEERLDLSPNTDRNRDDQGISVREGLPDQLEARLSGIKEAESKEVARYDDESMPYSFLWWLHKTRKDHADTYQPYVDFKLDTTRKIKRKSGEELNQQIIENIFHLQSPLDELDNKELPKTVPFELKRKEEEIIEKFIREEPQIHPPSPDKLDMENKARKSAEDPNDLVSETLATIYTEQMLFHKAIDTYQKLSLKFPEKRAYFADQISELKKKIN